MAGVLVVFSLFIAGCEAEEGPFTLEKDAALEIQPDGPIVFFEGSMSVGETQCRNILVRNTGDGDLLQLNAIYLEYDAPSEPAPAFFLNDVPAPGTLVSALGQGAGTGIGEEAEIRLCYRRHDDGHMRIANLVIESNDPNKPKAMFPIEEQEGQALLVTVPAEVVFSYVEVGKFKDMIATVLNTGSEPVEVDALALIGDEGFTVFIQDEGVEYTVLAGQDMALDNPISIGSNESLVLRVRFKPTSTFPRAAAAALDWRSGSATGTLSMPIRGNEGPCIHLEPAVVDFGFKKVGGTYGYDVQITACGQDPLEIRRIRLGDSGSPNFVLDENSFQIQGGTGYESAEWPSSTYPAVIPPQRSARYIVLYTPTELSPMDEEGTPVPEVTTGYVETNTFEGEVSFTVNGYGSTEACSTAVITVEQGLNEVAPQTVLDVSGSNSIPASGTISNYVWNVERPEGAEGYFFLDDPVHGTVVMGDTAVYPDVKYALNTAGVYRFRLDVEDSAGNVSCLPAYREITVIPDEAIHVELTWETPGDTDPFDGFGSDMDLHFVHIQGANAADNPYDYFPPPSGDGLADGYFDPTWDAHYWWNSGITVIPDWGTLAVEGDTPTLDRDDTDGTGPENLNLNLPEDGINYRIGVHYRYDNEFGPSTPTVRVYIYGVLTETIVGCPMTSCSLWDVGIIAWPNDMVDSFGCDNSNPLTPCGTSPECSHVVIQDYAPSVAYGPAFKAVACDTAED
ncbi:MAG: hypothetical protein CMH54_02450 [Myxococcales bacterium]|nr:hypothetical protein [Myxococcales bacterium]